MSTSPSVDLQTKFGNLSVVVGGEADGTQPAWVLVYKRPWEEIPFLRVHSSCLFSESFQAVDCDCNLQLSESLSQIALHGGALVYLYQEGRGIGLFGKVRAIACQQEEKLETAEAYKRLGFELDPRDYKVVGAALDAIQFPRTVRLATNNPRKQAALESAGYKVVLRERLKVQPSDQVAAYLDSKVRGLGHHE